MIPTAGRIVHYRLSRQDAASVNSRRADARLHMGEHRSQATGVQVHVGNGATAGDIVPLLVVRVWDNEYPGNVSVCRDALPGQDWDELVWTFPESPYGINGQAFLDGNDTLWITSAPEGAGPGFWSWPKRGEG